MVEILACTKENISIFNYNYEFIGSIPVQNAQSFIVAQDVDGDGLVELVINKGFFVYVFDTVAPAPTPRALSQFNFYSQHRGRSPYYTEFGPLAPVVQNEYPVDNSFGQVLNPLLSVYVFDYQGGFVNVSFRTNASAGLSLIHI